MGDCTRGSSGIWVCGPACPALDVDEVLAVEGAVEVDVLV
jgi:hypothetical protein